MHSHAPPMSGYQRSACHMEWDVHSPSPRPGQCKHTVEDASVTKAVEVAVVSAGVAVAIVNAIVKAGVAVAVVVAIAPANVPDEAGVNI